MDAATLKLARMMRGRPISQNELFWIDVIRLASKDADPAPTLAVTQALRSVFERKGDAPAIVLTTAEGDACQQDRGCA